MATVKRPPSFKTADTFKKPFDIQHSTEEHLQKELIKDKYTADTIGGTNLFASVILAKEQVGFKKQTPAAAARGGKGGKGGTATMEPETSLVDTIYNTIVSFFSSEEGEEQTTSAAQQPQGNAKYVYRIYVPELHSGLGKIPDIADLEELDRATGASQTPSEENLAKFALLQQKLSSYPIAECLNPSSDDMRDLKVGDNVWVSFQNSRTYENAFITSKLEVRNTSSPNLVKSGPINGILDENISNIYLQDDPYTEEPYIKVPPEYNGRWLVPYSKIMDLMIDSKGVPFRHAMFPEVYSPEARYMDVAKKHGIDTNLYYKFEKLEDYENYLATTGDIDYNWVTSYTSIPTITPLIPNTKQNVKTIFNTCRGLSDLHFIQYCLIYLEIINVDGKIQNSKNSKEDTVFFALMQMSKKSFFTDSTYPKLLEAVQKGKQVPGDVCLHFNEAGTNIDGLSLVISYPDPNKEYNSLVWSNFKTSGVVNLNQEYLIDGNIPWACVGGYWGEKRNDKKNLSLFRTLGSVQNTFLPMHANLLSKKVGYFRVTKPYLIQKLADLPERCFFSSKSEYTKLNKADKDREYPYGVDEYSQEVSLVDPTNSKPRYKQIISEIDEMSKITGDIASLPPLQALKYKRFLSTKSILGIK